MALAVPPNFQRSCGRKIASRAAVNGANRIPLLPICIEANAQVCLKGADENACLHYFREPLLGGIRQLNTRCGLAAFGPTLSGRNNLVTRPSHSFLDYLGEDHYKGLGQLVKANGHKLRQML